MRRNYETNNMHTLGIRTYSFDLIAENENAYVVIDALNPKIPSET